MELTESLEVQVFLEGFGGCEGSEGDGSGGGGFGGNGFKNIRWLPAVSEVKVSVQRQLFWEVPGWAGAGRNAGTNGVP